MADSFVDTLSEYISPSLVSRIGTAYGESQPAVTKAFAAAIPALLGMVTVRAHDPEFISQVYALAKNPESDSTVFDHPTRFVDYVTSPTRDGGPVSRFRSLIFGTGPSRFVDTLAGYAGMKTAAASAILSAAIPMVLAYIGKIIRQDDLYTGALGKRLAAEHVAVANSVPSAFAPLVNDAGRTGARVGSAAQEEAARALAATRPSVWPWAATALSLLALAGLLWYSNKPRVQQSARTIQTTPQAVGTVGREMTRTLPNGVNLRVPAFGSEARLLDYISSGTPASTASWIDFDRIGFETDSASLTTESREQLTNIASILKAYPAVHLKIGGYTDNSGDPAANMKLSQERATSVMNQLVGMGIPADRLEAEGYGEQHPIASNDTADGRAKNRRVAFRVTAR